MRNKLAVIGAGDFQNQLIRKAKSRGMYLPGSLEILEKEKQIIFIRSAL